MSAESNSRSLEHSTTLLSAVDSSLEHSATLLSAENSSHAGKDEESAEKMNLNDVFANYDTNTQGEQIVIESLESLKNAGKLLIEELKDEMPNTISNRENEEISKSDKKENSHVTSSDADHDHNYIYIKYSNSEKNNSETTISNNPQIEEEQAGATGGRPGTSYSIDDLPEGYPLAFHPFREEMLDNYLREIDHLLPVDPDERNAQINQWEMAVGLQELRLRGIYDHDEDVLDIFENTGLFDLELLPSRFAARLEETSKPAYPCNKKEKATCEICYEENVDVRKRLCCDSAVCETCQVTYLKNEVDQRNVRMQCLSCDSYVHRDEILALLPIETKEKFYKFLTDENKDPNIKTCPRCSVAQKRGDVSPLLSRDSKKKQKKTGKGLKVTCPRCALVWCFDCHAPWHTNIKCKDYKKGDKLVKNWAKEVSYGQKNAVKCPKCNVFIQRKGGCSHMTCSKCNTSFCYRCGHRYMQMKLIGKHSDRFSPFGCKYNLLPERPAARKAIRGGFMCAKILGGIGLGILALGAVAIFIGGSVIFVPAYLGERYRRKRRYQRMYRNYHNIHRAAGSSKSNGVTGTPEPVLDDIVMPFELDGASSPDSSNTMTSTDSGASIDHTPTEVKVWVHSIEDQKPVEVVQFKSQEQQTTPSSNHDNTVTTAQVTMENDMVVLHVKTTNKSGEVNPDKHEVEGSENQSEENKGNVGEGGKSKDLVVDSQGCFVKILGKLPVKWDKEDGKEVTMVTTKTAVVKDKKRKLGSKRSKSVDIPESEISDVFVTEEIHKTLQVCDETDPYYGLVAIETCDTGL